MEKVKMINDDFDFDDNRPAVEELEDECRLWQNIAFIASCGWTIATFVMIWMIQTGV